MKAAPQFTITSPAAYSISKSSGVGPGLARFAASWLASGACVQGSRQGWSTHAVPGKLVAQEFLDLFHLRLGHVQIPSGALGIVVLQGLARLFQIDFHQLLRGGNVGTQAEPLGT